MKPDGKIQGVDVWVKRNTVVRYGWYISNSPTCHKCPQYVNRAGKWVASMEPNIDYFPTRETALAHLRELEAKERPVIDLTKAKFGDKFKRGDGHVETYACPQEHTPGWHVMQSGETYKTNGCYLNDPEDDRNLIAPYVEPRTRTPWVMLFCDSEGDLSCEIAESEEGREQWIAQAEHDGYTLLAQKQTPITEGEGLTQPDVV